MQLNYWWIVLTDGSDSHYRSYKCALNAVSCHPICLYLILIQIIPHFFPPLEGQVRQGVFNSLTFIMEKRVLAWVSPSSRQCVCVCLCLFWCDGLTITYISLSCSHLAPLFDNPKLDRELRSMLRERFPEFCSSPSPPTEGYCSTHSVIDYSQIMALGK